MVRTSVRRIIPFKLLLLMYNQIWEVTNSFFTRDIDDFIALDRPPHKWQNAYLGYDNLCCFMLCEYFQYHYFGQKAK